MVKVFVSGCYDIIHAGHLQFFQEARSLGDHLTVCFASDEVFYKHKKRKSSIPQDHKQALLNSIRIVDEVVVGYGTEVGLDFKQHLIDCHPDILAVTDDDKYRSKKEALCKEFGIKYVVLSKTPPKFTPVSTTSIIQTIRAPFTLPLRVDFGGGWLDVPKFSIKDGYIVNCAVSPTVTLNDWKYKLKSGLGGSGAWALLNGSDGIQSELNLGVGWQDPAIIQETGLCVWRSGVRPVIEIKRNGDFLNGLMAISYTGVQHDTPANANKERDFELIKRAGWEAYQGVVNTNIDLLANAMELSYNAQVKEGMDPLDKVDKSIARKYCGGGWGGYALYLFKETKHRDIFVSSNKDNIAIEPYLK